MADATLATTETSSGAVGGSPGAGKKTAAQKKAKGSTAASAHSKPSHPPTSEMVDGAIKSLKERGGSSLQAIKKYVAANYKVDAEKLSPFIKKYLKSAVVSGALVQTKGKGASGSFKLAGSGKQPAGDKASKRSAAAKPSKTAATAAKKPKIAKKAVKKSPKGKKSATPAAPKTPAKAKTPSKAKKTTKVPTKKPKAPKPKKAKPAASKPSPAKKTPKRK